jgi:hypothetical protein
MLYDSLNIEVQLLLRLQTMHDLLLGNMSTPLIILLFLKIVVWHAISI